jgi:hypothetical protein
MKNLNIERLALSELSYSEIKSINGGDVFESIGYVAGFVAGTIVFGSAVAAIIVIKKVLK